MKRISTYRAGLISLSILILLMSVFTSLTSCAEDAVSGGGDELDGAAGFELSAEWVVVRGELASEEEIDAATYLRSTLSEIYGFEIGIISDWVKPGGEIVPGKYEILVGNTNRPQSAELAGELFLKDYTYKIYSENVIAVNGGSGPATMAAAEAFLAGIFGWNGETATVIDNDGRLKVGGVCNFAYEYEITNLTINGEDIGKYRIVVPSRSGGPIAAAERFASAIGEYARVKIEIVTAAEAGEAGSDYEIFIGSPARGTEKAAPLGQHEYVIKRAGTKISIEGGASTLTEGADHLAGLCFAGAEVSGGTLAGEIAEGEYYGIGLSGETSRLEFVSEDIKQIKPGITNGTVSYADKDGLPVVAYVMEIQPGAAMFITGTPDNGTATSNVSATVVNMAVSAKSAGYDVIGGVNADYFKIKGDYSPNGLFIKDGVVLYNEKATRPFIGFTKDGRAVIGGAAPSGAELDELYTAVGGDRVILQNYAVGNIGAGDAHGYTRHPRTAAGIKPDGTVILIVVDGRQPAYSNGASLGDLALILKQMGAQEAINLDGGGSSTYILPNGNTFSAINKVSDGSLRRVFNSLLVVAK